MELVLSGALKYFPEYLLTIQHIGNGKIQKEFYELYDVWTLVNFLLLHKNYRTLILNNVVFVFRVVFDVVNMLQGVWIFIIFIVFNPDAKSIFCPANTTTNEEEVPMDELWKFSTYSNTIIKCFLLILLQLSTSTKRKSINRITSGFA